MSIRFLSETRPAFGRSAIATLILGALSFGCSSKQQPIGYDDDTGTPAVFDASRNDSAASLDAAESGADAASDGASGDADATLEATSDDGAADAVDDAFADASDETDVAADAAPEASPDASTAIVPIGILCSTDTLCDPTGAGVGLCSNHLYPPDTTDPDPVCIARKCALGASGTIARCGEGDVGICVPGGGDNQCFPACTFNASGSAAATGCKGKDACNVYGWTKSSTGVVSGVGFCNGGCTADADCKSGDKCQTRDGVCVASLTTYAKSTGDSCVGADGECPCVLNPSTLMGFCTQFCITGSTAAVCPTGFACDPGLLAKDDTGATLFTGVAPGLVGSCYKKCSSDADCTSISAYCDTTSATGVAVCRAGPKP